MNWTLPELADLDALNPAPLRTRLQQRLDGKTKPLGSLGQIEALALRIGLILGTEVPQLQQPQLLVFAADHGLAAQGVSAYPSEVTAQMVLNFLAGGAAVSVLARQHGLALTVLDCGVRAELPAHPALRVCKVAHGSADSSLQPAMSAAQCSAALGHGAAAVRSLPGNALLLGEMGIGNTSAAALLLARLGGVPIEDCTGAGTGLDAAGVQRKTAVLRAVLQLHAQAQEPLDALAALGGFEIAAMVGAVLEAAAQRRVIVVDGFITGAAVLVAARLQPLVLQRCVFAHCGAERGHARLLELLAACRTWGVESENRPQRVQFAPDSPPHSPAMGPEDGAKWAAADDLQPTIPKSDRLLWAEPLLHLGLRLGEGSGAALAWPLLVSACMLLEQMASFESAGVSQSVPK